jgi:hypothetical protein
MPTRNEIINAIVRLSETNEVTEEVVEFIEKAALAKLNEPDPAITDLELEKESKQTFPVPPTDAIDQAMINMQRIGYIEGRRKSLSIQKEMGELLMTKDGEIESLLNDVAELNERLQRLIAEKNAIEEELALYRIEK